MKNQVREVMSLAGIAIFIVGFMLGGCSTKSGVSTSSGADATPVEAGMQTNGDSSQRDKAGGSEGSMAGVGTEPGTEKGTEAVAVAGKGEREQSGEANGSVPITGFSKTPLEEKITEPATMVVAKAEPSLPNPRQAPREAREADARQLADIYFAFDKWTLSAEGKKNLSASAEFLKQHPEAKLAIEGYCDERGSREYNLVLGEKRAQESLKYLAALGIKNPVTVTSYGKERPVCRESDESCYWKNRRGHLVVEDGQ